MGERLITRVAGALALAMLVVSLLPGGCVLDRDGGGSPGAGGDAGPGACDHCPGLDTTCHYRSCEDVCGFADAPERTPCTESEGRLCNSRGECVACLVAEDCDADQLCLGNRCAPATCANGDLDGDESDTDCGGSCLPCGNGESCVRPDDCASHLCVDLLCAPCGDSTECQGFVEYCDAGACVPRKAVGDLCENNDECLTDSCADGLCCDNQCDATCVGCVLSKTGSPNGMCAPITMGTDPDSECADAPTCIDDAVHVDAVCDVGACLGQTVTPCAPFACDSGACLGTCSIDAHCSSGNCCDASNNCVNKLPLGVACVAPGDCCSGFCRDGVCCDEDCMGVCRHCRGLYTNGGVDGICDLIQDTLDPNNECSGGNDCAGDAAACD